jgi:hypothetical protein
VTAGTLRARSYCPICRKFAWNPSSFAIPFYCKVRQEIAEKLTIEAQGIFNGKVYTLIVENTKESPLMLVISNNIKPDGTPQNQLNILRKWCSI